MGKSAFRKMVSCVLLFLFPCSMFAADSNAAMLYTNGAAWVNGAHVPRSSSAIFSGDLLQTRSDSVANINEPGSSITVLSDSLVTVSRGIGDDRARRSNGFDFKGCRHYCRRCEGDTGVEFVDGIQRHRYRRNGAGLLRERATLRSTTAKRRSPWRKVRRRLATSPHPITRTKDGKKKNKKRPPEPRRPLVAE